MTIVEFAKSRQKTFDWLAERSAEMEQLGHYFSDWPHDGGGFGLVITAYPNSGELHLMPDGNVTYHVEGTDAKTSHSTVLEQVSRKTASLNDFEYIYRRFRGLILGVAPINTSSSNPPGSTQFTR